MRERGKFHWLGSAAALFGLLPCTASALELTGNFVQGGLLYGTVSPGTYVEMAGEDIRLGPGGEFIIGLDRDAPAELVVTTRDVDGNSKAHRYQVAPRDYAIQCVTGIEQRIMEPNPADVVAISAKHEVDFLPPEEE